MARLFLASIAVVSALAVVPHAVEAQKPTPKKGALPKSNQVYVKIIWPTASATDDKDRPVVESWIAEQLKKRGQAKFTAVTAWVPLAVKGEESTPVWDGNLGDTNPICPVSGQIVERADGRIKVRLWGWHPGGAEVIVSLTDEPGSREIAAVEEVKTEQGLPYVAVLIGPPPEKLAAPTEEKESTGEEKIEWGKETRGQVANLRALKTVVKSGEPIEFEIRVKNVSNRDVYLPSGHADEKLSPCFWTFYFDQWEWRSAHLSARQVSLKPGETASVRCLVATTRDSMTAEQKERRFFHAPFRHMQNKKESDRLPEGTYRVRAIYNGDDGLKSNTIEVRIMDRR